MRRRLNSVLLKSTLLQEVLVMVKVPSPCRHFGRMATSWISTAPMMTMCSALSMLRIQWSTQWPFRLIRPNFGYPPIWSALTALNCLRTNCSSMAPSRCKAMSLIGVPAPMVERQSVGLQSVLEIITKIYTKI